MPRDGDVSGGGGTPRSKPQTLEADLARLEGMDTAGLGRTWERRHGSPSPAPLPGRLLRLALAYDLQADVLGGLTAAMEMRATGSNESLMGRSPRFGR